MVSCNKKLLADINNEIARGTIELEKYLSAFGGLEALQGVIDSVTAVNAAVQESIATFKGSNLETTAMISLLREQMQAANTQILTLDENSEAFKNLQDEMIKNAALQLVLLGHYKTMDEAISGMNLTLNSEKEAMDRSNESTFTAIDAVNSLKNTAGDSIGVQLDSAKITTANKALTETDMLINAIASIPSHDIKITSYQVGAAIIQTERLQNAIITIPSKSITINTYSVGAAINQVQALIDKINSIPGATITIGTSFHEGGELHTGGTLYAHEGLGLYGGRKEVPFVGLEGEQVINPRVSDMYSQGQWQDFQNSGDPGAFGGGGGGMTVVVNEPGPLTSVSFTDKNTVPRTNERKRYSVENPF